MSELLSWLKEYSPGVVVLIAIGAAVAWVLKQTVEHTITKSFDAHAKEMELGLERRSAFRDRVLTDRYTRIAELTARLERVMTNLNRHRHGNFVSESFFKGTEIVPLTEIYEDISIHRLTLTDEFHDLFRRKAALVLAAANALDDNDRWKQLAADWRQLDDEFRAAVERAFKLSEISY